MRASSCQTRSAPHITESLLFLALRRRSSAVLHNSGTAHTPAPMIHTTGGYMVYAATTCGHWRFSVSIISVLSLRVYAMRRRFKYVFDFHPTRDVMFCTADGAVRCAAIAVGT